MNEPRRMSPWTALFIGIFLCGGLVIAGTSSMVLYAMRVADNRITDVFGLVDNTIEGLPGLIESLPPALGDVLNDRRAPDYIENLDIDVAFLVDERNAGLRPVMTIQNKGDEVVSMLAVRVAALTSEGVPMREWTEVVATPIAIDDEWRGPLMPHATRHVTMRYRSGSFGEADNVVASYEVSEIRVWEPEASRVALTSLGP